MKRSLILSAAVLLAALTTSGCHFFSKKEKKPKESPAIATDTEVAFKLRWVDRRVGELTATGLSADAARAQAEAEFREHYSYTHAANK